MERIYRRKPCHFGFFLCSGDQCTCRFDCFFSVVEEGFIEGSFVNVLVIASFWENFQPHEIAGHEVPAWVIEHGHRSRRYLVVARRGSNEDTRVNECACFGQGSFSRDRLAAAGADFLVQLIPIEERGTRGNDSPTEFP